VQPGGLDATGAADAIAAVMKGAAGRPTIRVLVLRGLFATDPRPTAGEALNLMSASGSFRVVATRLLTDRLAQNDVEVVDRNSANATSAHVLRAS
jgi:hypothetical protein